MAVLGEFLNALSIKAGVKPDDDFLKSLLASPELQNIKIPDELVTNIDKGLLNIEAAKNNHPDIKRKYFADAYDGMDKHLLNLIQSDTFEDDELTEITAEKSTAKKIELAIAKLKAAKDKAKPEDKAAINQQIKDLHEQVRQAKAAKDLLVKDYENKIKDIHLKARIESAFGSYKTIYDELPGKVKNASLRAIIDEALLTHNAELTVSEDGELAIIGKDGANVFGSDHIQLTPKSFLDKSLAPILKVSNGQAQASKTNGASVQTTTAVAANNGQPATNPFLQSFTQQALKSIETQQATNMI